MPFYDFKSNVDHSTLYTIGKPFELLHADIADTRFLKSEILSFVGGFVYFKSIYLSHEKKKSFG